MRNHSCTQATLSARGREERSRRRIAIPFAWKEYPPRRPGSTKTGRLVARRPGPDAPPAAFGELTSRVKAVSQGHEAVARGAAEGVGEWRVRAGLSMRDVESLCEEGRAGEALEAERIAHLQRAARAL
jgi:hypothetical protein